ncbi:BolA-like protein 2 [Trichinella sp. T6]|nr:BolA-like protein 2 [Trichinella sp. T6]
MCLLEFSVLFFVIFSLLAGRYLGTPVRIRMDKKIIEDKLNSALQPMHMVVNDVSDGCGLKYNLLIVSETFKDKSILDCHRQVIFFPMNSTSSMLNFIALLVQTILREEMPIIHALSISTFTPDQWNKMPVDEEMHSSSEDGWNAFEQHHDMSWITIC